MKRDVDLVREILMEIEKSPSSDRPIRLNLPDHSDEEISYHVQLLADVGFVEAGQMTTFFGDFHLWEPTRLTWDGHEFLEASRNETTWKKAKARMLEKVGGLVLSVLKTLLIEMAKDAVSA